jgi:hypothetical protein
LRTGKKTKHGEKTAVVGEVGHSLGKQVGSETQQQQAIFQSILSSNQSINNQSTAVALSIDFSLFFLSWSVSIGHWWEVSAVIGHI